ncbi:MAG: sensor histidine kinase [Armatimonadota bacterium]
MQSDVVKILLVEDTPSDAELLQEILQQTGMPLAITCVEFLEEALTCLQQEAFDALLLDLSLPDSTGAETYHRARSAAPHLPIVVLTGDGNEEIGLEAVRFGIQDYLVKGRADGHQVARAIRYAIERKQMEDALKQLHAELEVRVCERTAELAQANEALQREMSERIRAEAQQLTAVMAERTRIAGEIHDTLAQGLTGIIIHLETADYLLEQDHDAARTRMQQAHTLARDSLTEARRSVMALRPRALEKDDLVTALQALIKTISSDSSIVITFSHQGVPYPLSPDMEHDLLRLCQEAINNALKHAHARQIRASLIFGAEGLELRVEDDGQGFDPSHRTRSNSFGLRIMKERVASMGGELTLISHPGQGTSVVVLAPCDIERVENER